MEKKNSKADLLSQARIMCPSPKYKIRKIEKKFESGTFNIKFHFLAVGNPELNPIDMI